MGQTRRFVLAGGAALALAASSAARVAVVHLKDGWQNVGWNKFAHSPGEAIARLPEALTRMKFPVALADVHAELQANPTGRKGALHKGDQELIAMVSGKGEVDFNVPLNFQPVLPGLQPPIVNTLEWDIGGYTLILPEICFNWCYRKVIVPVVTPPPATCDCCVQVRYWLPAGTRHVSYAVFGPYTLDLNKCGHPGQWDHGCVEHRCFEEAETKVIAWERSKGVVIDDHWRQDGGYLLKEPTTQEELHAIWLPHEVVNGFGLIICADSGDGNPDHPPAQALKFDYMAWIDPYTRERMWHMPRFRLFEG